MAMVVGQWMYIPIFLFYFTIIIIIATGNTIANSEVKHSIAQMNHPSKYFVLASTHALVPPLGSATVFFPNSYLFTTLHYSCAQ